MSQTRSRTKVYNDLLPHVFEECSDLPNLSRIGIFSCHACDMWRERQIHSARKTDTPRCQLNSRFQCSRKKNKAGIRVRVICGQELPAVNAADISNITVMMLFINTLFFIFLFLSHSPCYYSEIPNSQLSF